MERITPQSIGDILRVAFQDNCMQARLDEYTATDLWQSIIGTDIARKCRRPYVKNGIMTVGVPNAALRHELAMSRSTIRLEINRMIGKDTITEIRFTS